MLVFIHLPPVSQVNLSHLPGLPLQLVYSPLNPTEHPYIDYDWDEERGLNGNQRFIPSATYSPSCEIARALSRCQASFSIFYQVPPEILNPYKFHILPPAFPECTVFQVKSTR